MSYRCVATSRAGFIQQLAVGYISNGYYFYVAGVIPSNKSAIRVDEKILAAYDIAISKWTRARRKRAGQANVQYLRYGRFYVIIATHGVHSFFSAESKRLRDIRKTPILFMGYSIGCRRARGGGPLHASVRINRKTYFDLKRHFEQVAVNCPLAKVCQELRSLPFEPYAPVRCQYRRLLRVINGRRAVAGLEPVPPQAVRTSRSPVRPFEPFSEDVNESPVRFSSPPTTDFGD